MVGSVTAEAIVHTLSTKRYTGRSPDILQIFPVVMLMASVHHPRILGDLLQTTWQARQEPASHHIGCVRDAKGPGLERGMAITGNTSFATSGCDMLMGIVILWRMHKSDITRLGSTFRTLHIGSAYHSV